MCIPCSDVQGSRQEASHNAGIGRAQRQSRVRDKDWPRVGTLRSLRGVSCLHWTEILESATSRDQARERLGVTSRSLLAGRPGWDGFLFPWVWELPPYLCWRTGCPVGALSLISPVLQLQGRIFLIFLVIFTLGGNSCSLCQVLYMPCIKHTSSPEPPFYSCGN